MDDFGLLVGRYLSSLPTLTSTQLTELQVDSSGRLIIAGRFIAGTDSYAAADSGLSILAVRADSDGALSGIADGEYSPLQVDENGRLKVVADIEVANGHEKAEDSAHISGDIGSYMLAVREDTRPTGANVSASGDYASIFVNASGELYVKDTDVLTKLTEIDTVLDTIKSDTAALVVDLAAIETELLDQGTTLDSIDTDTSTIAGDTTSIDALLTALSKAEDSAHGSGDQGIMSLAVQQTADVALAGDGDYAPLQVDASGYLKVVVKNTVPVTFTPPGSEAYNASDSLGANLDGLIDIATTTFVDVCSVAVGAGETGYIYGWQWDCDKNAVGRLIVDDGTSEYIYKVKLNSSAMPGRDEHFSEGGRIEIAGSATTSIKIQVRKRSTTGTTGHASGSLHVRIV